MAKIIQTGTIHLRLLIVLMSLSSIAVAVNIKFYSTTDCSGSFTPSNGAPEKDCILLGVDGSVAFDQMNEEFTREVFTTKSCDSGTPAESGKGNGCFRGRFKAARWYNPNSPTELSRITRIETEKSTSIVFTKDCGSWVLKVPDVDELLSELQSLPDAKKVNWLKTKGAVFHPSTADMKTI